MAILSVRRNGVSHFYHHDGLGSTTQLTDANQNVTDEYVYDSWGNIITSTGTTTNPLKYVGQENYYTDGQSGLVLLGERVVNPTIGRLLTEDMLSSQGNSYAYAMGFSKGIGGGIISESIPPGGVVPIGYIPGVGPGQCPGNEAFAQVQKWLTQNKGCSKAFNKVCEGGGGFAGEVKQGMLFTVQADCLPSFKKEDSACMFFTPVKPKCKPKNICFATKTCAKGVKMESKACLLLLEVVNWCSCKYRNKADEVASAAVIDTCGLQNICHPGT